jgi:hypothetical protein
MKKGGVEKKFRKNKAVMFNLKKMTLLDTA